MNFIGMLLAFVAFFPLVLAHSWVEQLMKIGSNGAFVGEPGYPRHFVARTEPGYNDDIFVNLIPPNNRAEGPVILPDDNISKYPSGPYRPEFPMLEAAAGDTIALRYQENGHVSLPDTQKNKPLNRGTVYIYGTAEAKDDDKLLSVFSQWKPDSNGPGRLLATRNYDDGQCHQNNDGQISVTRNTQFPKTADPLQGDKNLWCQNDIRLPNDLKPDTIYTLYWVWVWSTLSDELHANSKSGIFPMQGEGVTTPEIYTSVADVHITKGSTSDLGINSNFVSGEKSAFDTAIDVGQRAVEDQLVNMFQVDVDGTKFAQQPAPAGTTDNTATGAPDSNGAPDSPDKKEPANSGAVVTITVTANPTTVTNFVTVTVPAGGQGPAANPSVTSQAEATINLPDAEYTGVVNNAPRPEENSVYPQGPQPTGAAGKPPREGTHSGETEAVNIPAAINLPESKGESPEVEQFMIRGRRWAN